ncbi:MAG: Grx4 family monothiol glutaredoxin [Gammaproteobacteria bacterium]|nr:Grx4 family monothiol glutaredoxin [Gammaproteobacteria bacterium]
MSNSTREVIEGLLRDNPVVLFMKGNRGQPQCGFSAKVVGSLDMVLPDYLTVDVLQNPDIRDGIKEYGNWPTIPQLYVNGELIGGCDIITELFESGALGDMLGVVPPPGRAPAIGIDAAAAEIMTNAVESRPGMTIHLKIDAGFEHSLSLGPSRSGNVAVTAGPLTLELDRWSAARADGLRIAVRQSLQGQGFSFDNPNAPPPVRQLSVQELKAMMDRGEAPLLFDVRGADERAIVALPGARPWDEAAVATVRSLPADTPIVFHCHRGGRSQAMAERYRRQGYTRLFNLEGGIDAWAREIDPTLPRY